MSDNATLTPEMVGKLAGIAAREDMTPDAVAAGAVAGLIEREADVVAAIERGRADVRAGRVFSQTEVMGDVQAIIDAARRST